MCGSKFRRFSLYNHRFKPKLVCATSAGANLGVLDSKVSVLRQKLVIICATRAGAKLAVLLVKISILH